MNAAAPPATSTAAAPLDARALEPWGVVSAPAPRRGARQLGPVPLAVALSALAALAYVIVSPPAADLAAASYRADLFSRMGFTLWDNAWYGGHALVGYSLFSPALGAALGVNVLLALCTVLASALFAAIADRAFGRPAALAAAATFAVSLSGEMLSGRVPYTLGVALALACVLALQRGHLALALLAAPMTSLASPVAGAFLALAGIALAISERQRSGLWVAACALAPIGLLALVFPEGGYEPFAASAFWPQLAGVVVIALALPRRWRTLRVGAALYAFALAAAYVIHTPVGSNAERLGALMAAPLLVGVLWGRRPLLLALVTPALLYWQLATPVDDLAKVSGDPSLNASYYAPLRAELERLTRGAPTRVEVPMTGAHSESALVEGNGASATGLMLARGWERQLDTLYAPLFYRARLGPVAYREWLHENAVSFVALPNVRLDESALAEAALIRRGLPYLQEIWHSHDWRLFAVSGARPLATWPARLSALGSESFTLAAPSAGTYEVRLRFSPYWALASGRGCVREAPGGWTAIEDRAPGAVRVQMAFSPARVFDHDARCRA